eukprot:GAHX01001826.1.p1 GENE.GAHX01001826.1~~GAHX01001826.1.p1  ORF type:complete len:971 (-),score=200.63 GAHX01001826.1:269-3181(-)
MNNEQNSFTIRNLLAGPPASNTNKDLDKKFSAYGNAESLEKSSEQQKLDNTRPKRRNNRAIKKLPAFITTGLDKPVFNFFNGSGLFKKLSDVILTIDGQLDADSKINTLAEAMRMKNKARSRDRIGGQKISFQTPFQQHKIQIQPETSEDSSLSQLKRVSLQEQMRIGVISGMTRTRSEKIRPLYIWGSPFTIKTMSHADIILVASRWFCKFSEELKEKISLKFNSFKTQTSSTDIKRSASKHMDTISKEFRAALFRAKKVFREIQSLKHSEKRFYIVSKRTKAIVKEDVARKKNIEAHEIERQKKKLEFLIRQTELFSHFVASKLGVTDPELQSEPQEEIKDEVKEETQPETETIETPTIFKATLKHYQTHGLGWIVSLYEQGINGILADEMGLGKTIQALSFLCHLCEKRDVWGPFLVLAPSSVIQQWNIEIEKFCPVLKSHVYWGTSSERTQIRKLIPSEIGTEDSKFHVMISSYSMFIQDYRYLKKFAWQFIVLDEAQAVKSSGSLRWQLVVNLNCKNKLLLTGTPIQNNMNELWALLHIIMPQMFDSNSEFGKWFSKDVEEHAAGLADVLDEIQLSRLHSVLKPFMLRRLKKDVENELPKKKEILIECDLSETQTRFYKQLTNSLSGISDINTLNKDNILNLVMQLRKICNHPDLCVDLVTQNTAPICFNKHVPTHNKLKNYAHHLYLSTTGPTDYKVENNRFKLQTFKHSSVIRNMNVERRVFKIIKQNKAAIGLNMESEQRLKIMSRERTKRNVFCSDKMITLNTKIPKFQIRQYGESLNSLLLLEKSGKLKRLDELLFELYQKKHRVLIFSQMTKMIDIIETLLKYRKYHFLRFDGTTEVKSRLDLVDRFKNDERYFVFLLSTRAGGLGINLTSANVVIFYDNDWNPTMDAQAMDRVHRIGQTKTVLVYRLVCKNTIEERILKKAEEKFKIQNTVYCGKFGFKKQSDSKIFKTSELKDMLIN